MTRRERLLAIFRGDLPDRPAVKLWGASPDQQLVHPAYAPVHRAAIAATDLMLGAGSTFNLHWGQAAAEVVKSADRPTASENWIDVVTQYHTPAGILTGVFTRSTIGEPGYQKEYPLKEPADIRKMLSVPYRPFPFNSEKFAAVERQVGDRGITMFGLDHAMYGLERLVGSENFAYWSLECRDLLTETIAILADRIRRYASEALAAGLGPVFGWVGPELCIPPLMSPTDFDDFVTAFDRPLIDLIHEHHGHVWVHCHGRMSPVIDRFVEMGVDVLNPLEPPPMGDLTLTDAFARVGDRMGLEGNIETHELMTASAAQISAQVAAAIEAGRGRRFILCPSSGYMEDPRPSPRLIENLLTYVDHGVRFADAAAN